MAALPALFSCAEKEGELPMAGPGYEYRFPIADPSTKAVLNDAGVFWESADEVGLFLGDASGQAGMVDVTTAPKTIVFSTSSPLPEGTLVRACYPYQEGLPSATEATVLFPAHQQGGSLSAMPMAGIPFPLQAGETQGVIHFLNLGSIVDFRILSTAYAGEQVRSITLTATSGSHPLCGEATLDLTQVERGNEASLSVNWPDETFSPSSVTVTQTSTVTATKEISSALGNLYMVVAPGTYSGIIQVETNAATYTFPFADKTFARNGLKRFNLNLEGGNASREAYYREVTSAASLYDGCTCLLAYPASATEARLFHPVLSNGKYSGAVTTASVTSRGIAASAEVEACLVQLEAVPGTSSDYYLRVPESHYLSFGNNSIGTNRTATTLTFDNSGGVTVKQKTSSGWWSTTYYLRYNNSSFSPSTTSSTLALYMPDQGSAIRQPLQFSASTFSFLPGKSAFPIENISGTPTLSGAQTQVLYTSSDPSVATVDPATGALTILGEGRITITATAAADETHEGGSTSYTLEAGAFLLENEQMAAYLDYVEQHPYDPSDYSYSYVKAFSCPTSSTNRLDLPRPVPITWTNPEEGNAAKTVVVYNDGALTDAEISLSVSDPAATRADVYSLIPGRRYWYQVLSGSAPIAEGTFSTLGHRRIIKVGENTPYGNTYANNCRDLGGLETTDGRHLRYGMLYRGTNMDGTTDNGQKEYLLGYMGIGLDVDLREFTGHNPLGIPVSDQIYNSMADLTNTSRMKITIGDILDAVAEGKGVYIHCKVGADRTAFVCLLLEALLGVRQELCDVDYELTSFCACVDDVVRERGNKNETYYYYPRAIEFFNEREGATLQEKVVQYVQTELAISPERIAAYQEAMLE